MKNIIAALFGLALCGSAHGTTSDDLNAFCQAFDGTDDMESLGAAMCFGFTVGVADALENCFCFPDESTYEQYTFAVKEYLSDHPELHHLDGITLVRDAFEEAYPCSVESAQLTP